MTVYVIPAGAATEFRVVPARCAREEVNALKRALTGVGASLRARIVKLQGTGFRAERQEALNPAGIVLGTMNAKASGIDGTATFLDIKRSGLLDTNGFPGSRRHGWCRPGRRRDGHGALLRQTGHRCRRRRERVRHAPPKTLATPCHRVAYIARGRYQDRLGSSTDGMTSNPADRGTRIAAAGAGARQGCFLAGVGDRSDPAERPPQRRTGHPGLVKSG